MLIKFISWLKIVQFENFKTIIYVFDELSSTLNLKSPSTSLYHFVINNLFITILLLFFFIFFFYKIVIVYEIPENTYKQ